MTVVIRVRAAEYADIPAVVSIEQVSFVDPWSVDSFDTSLQSDRMRFLVAEGATEVFEPEYAADGSEVRRGDLSSVVGYVIALELGTEAEIADIAVAPEARGCGVGGALLDKMVEKLREGGVETLFLEVRESNSSARALYASRAFRKVGQRKGYYQSPVEDALVLRRDLMDT
ncbi:MAG: ribosomal protein S18-alanine N-acetyltransferase [bacterium]